MLLLARFRIYGHSMEPIIKNGDVVLLSVIPYLFSKPKTSNIVAFIDKKSKKFFIKRINKINRDKFFVKGDNEEDSLDSRKFGWIEKKEIVGKVIRNL